MLRGPTSERDTETLRGLLLQIDYWKVLEFPSNPSKAQIVEHLKSIDALPKKKLGRPLEAKRLLIKLIAVYNQEDYTGLDLTQLHKLTLYRTAKLLNKARVKMIKQL